MALVSVLTMIWLMVEVDRLPLSGPPTLAARAFAWVELPP
jgi:hypothetical protein